MLNPLSHRAGSACANSWKLLLVRSFIAIGMFFCVASSSNDANGQVTRSFTEPYEQRELAISQPQLLTLVQVREGEFVKKDAKLAEMDTEVHRERLNVAQLKASSRAKSKAAEARLKIHKRKVDALLEMQSKGFANSNEVRNAIMHLEELKAAVDLEKERIELSLAEVAQIKAEIEQRTIRSPMDGVVIKVNKKEGEIVSAGEARFATIVDVSRLRVRFYLSAEIVANLSLGQAVDLEVQYNRSVAKNVVGKVDFISPVISPDSGTGRIDVVIDNRTNTIRSGLPCRWVHKGSMSTETVSQQIAESLLPNGGGK